MLDGADYFEARTFTDLEDVAGKEFYKCGFEGLKRPGVRFDRCVFERCTFTDCDLTRMTLAKVSFRGVTFARCKLLGVDFGPIGDNPEVTFTGCNLRYAAFQGLNLRGTELSTCELQEAQFEECSLIETDFAGSDVTGATWTRCDFAGADFSQCTGLYFEVRGNQLKDAYIPVETAVMMAQAAGLRVAGFDKPKKKKER